VAVDGVLICGNGVRLDTSSVTGEIDPVYKSVYSDGVSDPFVLSGSKVEHGDGEIVVCCVGKYSFLGINRALTYSEEQEATSLQEKLEVIATHIGKVGAIVALIVVIMLLIYLVVDIEAEGDHSWDGYAWSYIVRALIIGITIIVVAVPEGLPLAVTLSLAYSVGKMR
jgi:magnesium-transporting ATPase (P-type)